MLKKLLDLFGYEIRPGPKFRRGDWGAYADMDEEDWDELDELEYRADRGNFDINPFAWIRKKIKTEKCPDCGSQSEWQVTTKSGKQERHVCYCSKCKL